jgi:hypothetical protein
VFKAVVEVMVQKVIGISRNLVDIYSMIVYTSE